MAEVTPNIPVAEVQKPHNLNATRNATLEYESESDRYVLLQGSEESTGIKITEYKNDTFRPVSGMNIKIVIKYPSSNNSEIIGHTDKDGIYSYKWIISEVGVFMVNLYAEKSGYSPLSKHYSFTSYPDKDAYVRYSGYNDLSLR